MAGSPSPTPPSSSQSSDKGEASELQRYIDARLDAARKAMAWKGDTATAMADWQRQLRADLQSKLGLDRFSPVPPEKKQDGDRITFATRPGYRATGYLLEPENPKGSVLCLPGHGFGADAIVGRAEEPYQANFARQWFDEGYRVLALEPMSFGARRSDRQGPHGWTCDADAKAALMLGETLAGWRIWDAMRAIDALAREGPVITAGISGGGMIALWTAALDTRVHAAVVSGYFCTFRESILSVDHCLDNFVPGVLDLIEMPDLAGLVAPRKLFVESGTDDPIFPIQGFRDAVERGREIYAGFEASENFRAEEFEGGHEYRAQAAFDWVRG